MVIAVDTTRGSATPLEKAAKKAKVDGYVVANRYSIGEPFRDKAREAARAKAAADGEAAGQGGQDEDEGEEELNDYERERQENILRNQAFLESLGLA
eukprot:SAG22_NODE_338_length_12038_cov_24.655583_7_plen_97_part_00